MLAAISAAAADRMARCADPKAAESAVIAVINEMYAAAGVDDLSRFRAIISPDFYAFDGGKTFPGTSLLEFVRDVHAKGIQIEWHVGPADVHVHCKDAWLTYTNTGAIGPADSRKPIAWLESAVLEWQAGRWRLRFFHSTRAAETP